MNLLFIFIISRNINLLNIKLSLYNNKNLYPKIKLKIEFSYFILNLYLNQIK